VKKIGIFALAAVLVLGLALSASANQTINVNPGGEPNLWEIINGWTGLSLTQANLEGAPVLETLGAGDYTVINHATNAGFSQTLTVPVNNDLVSIPANAGNTNTASNIPFSEAAAFPFTDKADGGTFTKSTINQNGAGNQSNGFIFDLFALSGNNATFAGQFIVAFEDGDDAQPYSDSDYNDMVARVAPVPIPPSALLMGSGLLGLGLVGWRRRFSA
jgi:hypothetical protein